MLNRWIIITVALAILFIYYPSIDLWVSGQFYNPEKGGFWLKENNILMAFYYIVKYSRYVLPVCFIALLIFNTVFNRKFILNNKEIIFLTIVLLLGPVLMTGIFKDNWHRARPVHTVNFGGEYVFTPAFKISESCPKDCYSFVSGHAAMGFYFTAFALVLPYGAPKKRRVIYISLLLFGAVISFSRVMQGQHYLSDVVFGGLFTLIIMHLVYGLMFHWRFLDHNPDWRKRFRKSF